ncbi:MAG: HD domain-containing protein [Pseudomonadota bacterium]
MKKIIGEIRDEARAAFVGHGCHSWDHTERVVKLALHIGKAEGADLKVIEIAALLHDIGRKKEDESLGKICHAAEGGRLAREILLRHKLPDKFIDDVVHCIERHRYRKESVPETLEGKVIFDADKIDAIGAVGIGRAFLFSGEHGAKLHNDSKVDPMKTDAYGPEDTAYREFLHKLQHVHRRLLTREGKRLAEGRHAFMADFFKRLNAEINGKV